jgi:hypothetical protein
MRMLKACRCLYRKTPAAALPSECSQTGTFVNARWELSTGNSQVLISLVVRKCALLDGGCKNFSYGGTKLKGDLKN